MSGTSKLGVVACAASVALIVVGEGACHRSGQQPASETSAQPQASATGEAHDAMVRRASAETAAGHSLLALKIIAGGTNAKSRANDPEVQALIVRIRADLVTAFGAAGADTHIEEALAPPTPTNLSRSDMLEQARAEMNAGHNERALVIVIGNASNEMMRTDVEVQALRDQINARMSAEMAPDQAQGFTSRVRTYWLPEVRAIPLAAPSDAASLWNAVAKLEEEAHNLEDGSALPLNAEGKKARAEFKAAISSKQRALFPVLRRAYGKVVGQAMWEDNVRVGVGGPGNRTVTWTAGMFADHTNIARAQEDAAANMQKVRFTRSAYRWATEIGEVNTYTMTPPSDDAIGYWEAGTFKSVE